MQKIKPTLRNFQDGSSLRISTIKFSKSILLCFVSALLSYNSAKAQLTVTGQFRERTEARGGQGTLLGNNQKGALFTSQRTRLNVGFAGYRYKVYASLQDVRVWGQDASTINRTTTDANDGLLLHEAWGEIMLNDTISSIQNLSLKIGRQEISYDDQKVLGSLDWLQQARRHDAIVLKFANKGWTADFGAAFNQRTEQSSGTGFVGLPTGYAAGTNGIQHAYKSFQYAYIGRKFFFGDMSFLFFKDDFSKFTGTPAVPTFTQGVNIRTTTGIYYNVNPTRKLNLNGSFYYQGGHDKIGQTISARLGSLTATYQLGRKFFVGPGVDYLSGTDGTTVATQNNQFDPLYGTPHKFWGTMDFFYVASPFGKQGLLNYFVKAKYLASDKLTLLLDVHGFESAAKLAGNLTPYLGTEVDLTVKYNFTKVINIEGGYSIMKATNTMASSAVKNVTTPKLTAQWAYVMLKISPNFLNTKKM
ncbi:alginate export family protein [Flavobacterium sp.]|uniref:alginate export family protein n=1 Tax=Flavobacterium sp. TaxID=239 RepID=UPI00286AE5A5|nr:alginate export family protein [Flavobacterium sp.]